LINTFGHWLIGNWNTIVDILIWILSILSVFFVASIIYKALKIQTTSRDYMGLIFALAWGFLIIYFGFDHVREALESLL